MSSYVLSAEDRRRFDVDGYLVREATFSPEDVSSIADDCEELVAKLVRHRHGERMTFGSYTFDADMQHDTVIKWEGDSDVVHGIEPFAHLSESLNDWAYDSRFIDPMEGIIGCRAPELFTEKLNLKRPNHGGANPLHQDHPYWHRVAEEAGDVYTAMLFLDDSTLANGCLQVVPGSHRAGEWAKRKDGDRFAANEIDADAYPEVEPVPVEVPAGSVIFFGAFLVHQSAPNLSAIERRAILYSYQPAGRRTQLEAFRAGWKAHRDPIGTRSDDI